MRTLLCTALTTVVAYGSLACGDNSVEIAPDAEPTLSRVDNFVPPRFSVESPARLIVLGDSISAGLAASTTARDYSSLLLQNDDEAWPEMAGKDLTTLSGGTVEFIDVAVSGAITNDVLRQQLPRLEGGAPYAGHTVVVMTIGGNDMTRYLATTSPGDILNNINLEVSRVAANVGDIAAWFNDERFPDGVSFIAANIYDPSDNTGEGGVDGVQCANLALLASFLSDLFLLGQVAYSSEGAEHGFAVADMYGLFLGHGYDFDDPEGEFYDETDPSSWFGDCIHPNDRGHHELRRLMYSIIDPSFRF